MEMKHNELLVIHYLGKLQRLAYRAEKGESFDSIMTGVQTVIEELKFVKNGDPQANCARAAGMLKMQVAGITQPEQKKTFEYALSLLVE